MALSRPPQFLFYPLFYWAMLCIFLFNSHNKTLIVSFNTFACCESWMLQTSSPWATCRTRNQAGGGQPLNHRMTLNETATHSFAVLQKHSGSTLNLAVKSTRRSAHSCYAFILCIFLLKKPPVLFLQTTDATVLQYSYIYAIHTQRITVYYIRLLYLVS